MRDLVLAVENPRLDLEKLFQEEIDVVLLSSTHKVFDTRITERDMMTLVTNGGSWVERSDMKDLKVDLQEGQVELSGIYEGFFNSHVQMTGELHVREQRYIDLEPISARVNRASFPPGPLKQLLRKLNPIMDFYEVPLQPQINSVTVANDEIRISSEPLLPEAAETVQNGGGEV